MSTSEASVVVTVEGVGVVEEFHKPFSSNQDVTVCTQNPEPGVTVVTEFLIRPRDSLLDAGRSGRYLSEGTPSLKDVAKVTASLVHQSAG
jgi:hypothetical protein